MNPSPPLRRCLGAALLAIAVGVSACGGGGGNDKDAQDLLDSAFGKSVKSADLLVDAQLKLKGGSSSTGPVRVRARGPYRGNEDKLPSVDLDLTVSPGSGGQAVSTGFLSTGDRAFVKFQDAYYEQPRAQVERTNRALAGRQGKRGSLKALGLNPRSWLRDAKKEGDDEVAGVSTTHVSGKLVVGNVMRDFNELLRKGGGALGAAGGATPPKPLSDEDIEKVTEVVNDPTFDVYVGKDDGVIRRVAGRLEFDVPDKDRSALGGLQGGTLEFSVELSDVGGDQRIEAPANARPLSDLTKSLGAGGVGGIAGGGGSPGTQTTPPPSGSSGGGTGTPGQSGGATAPDSAAFKRYAQCLDKADPSDRRALQRCAEQLK